MHICNYKDQAGFSQSVPANFSAARREIAKSPKYSLLSGFPDKHYALFPIYKALSFLPAGKADLLLLARRGNRDPQRRNDLPNITGPVGRVAGLHTIPLMAQVVPFISASGIEKRKDEARSSQNQGCFPARWASCPRQAQQEALGGNPHSGYGLPSN